MCLWPLRTAHSCFLGGQRSAAVADARLQPAATRVNFDVGATTKKIHKFGFELIDGQKIPSTRDPRFDQFTKFLRTSPHDVIFERLQDIHLGEAELEPNWSTNDQKWLEAN